MTLSFGETQKARAAPQRRLLLEDLNLRLYAISDHDCFEVE